MKRWSLPYGSILAPVEGGFERRIAQNEQYVLADEAERLLAEYKHKADQYDTVVREMQPADGGQHRYDVVSAIHRIKQDLIESRAREQRLRLIETAAKDVIEQRKHKIAAWSDGRRALDALRLAIYGDTPEEERS